MAKAYCLYCEKKPAKLPADRPRFCTLRCGLDWATMETERHIFCERHDTWTDVMVEGTQCLACFEEGAADDGEV